MDTGFSISEQLARRNEQQRRRRPAVWALYAIAYLVASVFFCWLVWRIYLAWW
jgi:type VI protein secretion system component VasF